MNPARYRRTVLTALTLIALVFSSGCWAQPFEIRDYFGADPAPDGSNVVVFFGDSIGGMAETDAKTDLKTVAPDQRWSYNAQGGTQIDQWSAPMSNRCPLDETGQPVMTVPCVPANGTLILELLTNDVTLNDHYQIDVDLIAALDAVADVRCVVIPLLNTEGGDRRGTPYSSRTHWVNDRLLGLVEAGTYPNLHVVRWDEMSAGHPEYLMGTAATPVDWVHYNSLGNPVAAAMIAHTPEACTS